MHFGQAIFLLVKAAVESVLLRHADKITLGVVDPAMETAGSPSMGTRAA